MTDDDWDFIFWLYQEEEIIEAMEEDSQVCLSGALGHYRI